MKRNTKADALVFTKALLQGVTDTPKQKPHEAKSKIKSLEGDTQSVIIKWLEMQMLRDKLVFQRTNTMGRLVNGIYIPILGQHKGFPDILIFIKGQCICLELKSNSGEQSASQISWQHLLEAQGIKYYVVRSLKVVMDIIENL